MMSLHSESLKIVEISDEQIKMDLPSWFPINEWAFKSFLVRHPEYIERGLEFIGYEIYWADLVFMKDGKLFIVEAKCLNPDENQELKINSAFSQLLEYIDKFKIVYNSRDIIPVIAILKKNNAKIKIRNLEGLWRLRKQKERQKKKILENLQHKIQIAEDKLSKLNRKIGERLTKLRILKKKIEMEKAKLYKIKRNPPKYTRQPIISIKTENEIILEKLLKGEI